jgi:hypothetical protein
MSDEVINPTEEVIVDAPVESTEETTEEVAPAETTEEAAA